MSLHFGLSRASCQCKCNNDCVRPFLLSWTSFFPLPLSLCLPFCTLSSGDSLTFYLLHFLLSPCCSLPHCSTYLQSSTDSPRLAPMTFVPSGISRIHNRVLSSVLKESQFPFPAALMLALLLLQYLEPEGWGMRSLRHQKESSFILKNKTGFQNGDHFKCGIMLKRQLVWAHFYHVCFYLRNVLAVTQPLQSWEIEWFPCLWKLSPVFWNLKPG